jgi:hypothetical protein
MITLTPFQVWFRLSHWGRQGVDRRAGELNLDSASNSEAASWWSRAMCDFKRVKQLPQAHGIRGLTFLAIIRRERMEAVTSRWLERGPERNAACVGQNERRQYCLCVCFYVCELSLCGYECVLYFHVSVSLLFLDTTFLVYNKDYKRVRILYQDCFTFCDRALNRKFRI